MDETLVEPIYECETLYSHRDGAGWFSAVLYERGLITAYGGYDKALMLKALELWEKSYSETEANRRENASRRAFWQNIDKFSVLRNTTVLNRGINISLTRRERLILSDSLPPDDHQYRKHRCEEAAFSQMMEYGQIWQTPRIRQWRELPFFHLLLLMGFRFMPEGYTAPSEGIMPIENISGLISRILGPSCHLALWMFI